MATAQINGFTMHYEDTGSGEAIIFQPGWISTEMMWSAVAPQLQDRYRCIVLETRGTGQSERTPTGHTIDQYADDLLALADHLGLERFSIAGHSMGGVVATAAARKAPDRVERIIMVASTADASFVPQPVWDMLYGLGEEIVAGNREATQGFFKGITARRDGVPFEAVTEAAIACAPEHVRHSIRSCAAYSPGEAVASVTTPTLVVGGSADVFLGAGINTHQALPNASLQVFNRASHAIPIDASAGLAEAIDDFMQHGVVTAEALMAG